MEEDQKQLQDAYRRKIEEMQKRREAEEQLRQMLQTVLDSKAYERMTNIKLSNEQLYLQLAQTLVTLYRQGQLKVKVTEAQLKELVSRMLSQRRETTIRRL